MLIFLLLLACAAAAGYAFLPSSLGKARRRLSRNRRQEPGVLYLTFDDGPSPDYTPALLEHGLKCMIGKGRRSPEVAESIVKNHAVYLLTIGGTAALTAQSIYKKEPVCYDDLGTEAVCRLYVQDFYAIVGIDCHGGAIV